MGPAYAAAAKVSRLVITQPSATSVIITAWALRGSESKVWKIPAR